MITEKDIQDWVHTGVNLIKDLSLSESDGDNLYHNTELCSAATGHFEIFQKVIDNLFGAKSYNYESKTT